MAELQIRFAPDILRRLGEELNLGPHQGILELVKNAYDADALCCTVQLRDIDAPGGSITVVDDGNGMSTEEIGNGWLVLGRSGKSIQKVTHLGRVPAGSKGLGRLAAIRLGTKVKLVSRPKTHPSGQYELTIEWKQYDRATVVEEVKLPLLELKRSVRSKSGTEIIISGISQVIRRTEVVQLARSMILLADPFGDNPTGFKPTLEAPEFRDLERIVEKRYFDEADYHLVASIDEEGRVSAEVRDWRGEMLFSADHDSIAGGRKSRTYECPPASFDFWAFLLTREDFAPRSTTVGEVRNWLQAFGGVHLYVNRVPIAAYGDPANDWLGINLRRVRNPEERPSTNNSIGRIAVEDKDDSFVAKTDRSGLIENSAFLELRAFAHDALEWMARRRLEAAERRRRAERKTAPVRSAKSKAQLTRRVQDLPPKVRAEIESALETYERSRDREVNSLRREVQLYRTLGTAGITAATFAHESSGNPLKVIAQSIGAIERRAKEDLKAAYVTRFQRPVESIKHAIESLAVLGSAVLSLIDHDKRRLGRVNVHRVVRNLTGTFAPFLDARDVELRLELGPGEPYLRATEAAIESVVANLINNSLAAFEQGTTDKRLICIRSIRSELSDSTLVLRFFDNGPGIENISVRDIWLPGQTTRVNGTGLGLTIVRDTITDLGGRVEAVEHGELGGAELVLELPVLGW